MLYNIYNNIHTIHNKFNSKLFLGTVNKITIKFNSKQVLGKITPGIRAQNCAHNLPNLITCIACTLHSWMNIWNGQTSQDQLTTPIKSMYEEKRNEYETFLTVVSPSC